MIGDGGIQLTGNITVSLTLDHASFDTRSGNSIDANLLDGLDLVVTNSRLSASSYRLATKVRCRKRLNVQIINSTFSSDRRSTAVDIGGNVIRATVEVESSTFNGLVLIDHFSYNLQNLVRSSSDLFSNDLHREAERKNHFPLMHNFLNTQQNV